MITEIELICCNCGKNFKRRLAEHNRNECKGRRVLCSRQCQGKLLVENFGENAVDIAQWCKDNNYTHKDEFSQFRIFLRRINGISSHTSRRKPNIDIDLQYLKQLWESQNGLCALTKIPMVIKDSSGLGPSHPYQGSVDRIDNNLPYQKGNVRFVCLIVNYARNGFSDEQVVDFIKTSFRNLAA